VNFHKAFDIVPHPLLTNKAKDVGLPPLVVSLGITLYETIVALG